MPRLRRKARDVFAPARRDQLLQVRPPCIAAVWLRDKRHGPFRTKGRMTANAPDSFEAESRCRSPARASWSKLTAWQEATKSRHHWPFRIPILPPVPVQLGLCFASLACGVSPAFDRVLSSSY